MTSTTQLSDRMAEALGLPKPTLALHMRNLREAGLITRGGRGRSAARMTVEDAATLLMAAVGSSQVQESVSAVLNFRSLVFDAKKSESVVLDLPSNHTFGAAIARYINGFYTGAFRSVEGMELNFQLKRPALEAQIEGDFGRSGVRAFYFRPPDHGRDPPIDGDLNIISTFTHRTPWMVGELLGSGNAI